MDSRYYYKDVLPLIAMLATMVAGVGLNTVFKAASLKGMSYFVFIFYSNLINTLLLLPVPFFLCSRTTIHLFKFPLLSRICALGIIGLFAQLIGYKGIKYSSPTMASAMSNLTPAWTFLFAILFRMEKLDFKSSSTQSKIIGTIVSILGALMVVFYKGPTILSTSSTKPSSISLHQMPVSNWVIGGLFLALQHIFYAFLFIIQTQMMQICPSALLITFFSYLWTTILSAPVCFISEPDFSTWRIRPDITLIALIYSGILGGASLGIMHLWCLRLKGPVYVAAFMPLTIATAAVMSTIFLGNALHLGSVIGGVIISMGVYGVIWGKAKEEKVSEECVSCSLESSVGISPLLQGYKVEDSFKRSQCK